MTKLEAFRCLPLIAILRGIPTQDVEAVATCLVELGIKAIEIPLTEANSLQAVDRLCSQFGDDVLCGAGTVCKESDLHALLEIEKLALIVSPHVDQSLITQALSLGKLVIPGAFTPTEVIKACNLGVEFIKLFPASTGGMKHLSAIRKVIDKKIQLMPVGGVKSMQFSDWLAAGANGFGLGESVYRPGMTIGEIESAAKAAIEAYLSANNTGRN